MLSVIRLDEVKGNPVAKLDLPQLKVGDPVSLRFRIERENNGRTEELRVCGRFRVTAVGYDAEEWPTRQLLSVEAIGKPPTWASIKNRRKGPPRLHPARFPRTPV